MKSIWTSCCAYFVMHMINNHHIYVLTFPPASPRWRQCRTAMNQQRRYVENTLILQDFTVGKNICEFTELIRQPQNFVYRVYFAKAFFVYNAHEDKTYTSKHYTENKKFLFFSFEFSTHQQLNELCDVIANIVIVMRLNYALKWWTFRLIYVGHDWAPSSTNKLL